MSLDKYTLLKKTYGYDTFRQGQEELIDTILSGNDVVGIMPTGAGKSICYQIPALMMEGVTLVISPLISLMQDQVNALVQNEIAAAYINSSLTASQYYKVLDNIKKNVYKIIYVAPERLLNEAFLSLASELDIAMISVDEAHCISKWGQDFRISYTKIMDFVHQLSKRPVISAFTATATKEVKEDIIAMLEMSDPFTITTGFDRKNLYFEVRQPQNKKTELSRLLLKYKNQSGIIYCNTRKHVEEVCSLLQSQGFQAGMYHAGMSEEDRRESQQDFLYDRIMIMVATNAFGMGIDKSNVSFVIHYNMPMDMESYYQEAGRAGRDGSPADCILLYGAGDVKMNQFLINLASENTDRDPETLELLKQRDLKRLKTMTFYCHSRDCLRHTILKYFGEDSEGYCGNCFNCNHHFEEADITIEAQKILSCVKRMNERYGISMVVDVLKASENDRLLSLHLDQLSTYGIMKETSARKIREMIQYLLYREYLQSAGEEYPILKLGKKAKEILIDKQKLTMKIVKEDPAEKKKKKGGIPANVEEGLLESLRSVRMQLARKQCVPAYIIFNDASLMDMCRVKPQNEEEFLMVSGVGSAKLKRYGKPFLTAIKDYEAKQKDDIN